MYYVMSFFVDHNILLLDVTRVASAVSAAVCGKITVTFELFALETLVSAFTPIVILFHAPQW